MVIDNSGSVTELKQQIDDLWVKLTPLTLDELTYSLLLGTRDLWVASDQDCASVGRRPPDPFKEVSVGMPTLSG